jgi:hypothetical protein
MKELQILKELEDESINGMCDGNNHIKALVIELLCERYNFNIEAFKELYNRLIIEPVNEAARKTPHNRMDEWYKNRLGAAELGFYRLAKELDVYTR